MEFKKKTKKEMYDNMLFDMRTYINGETAIKPYYFLRNGVLHVRYTVDRCVKLSPTESARLKVDLTASPQDKQSVLAKAWNFFTVTVGKDIILDGIAELERQIKEFKKNGRKDKGSNV